MSLRHQVLPRARERKQRRGQAPRLVVLGNSPLPILRLEECISLCSRGWEGRKMAGQGKVVSGEIEYDCDSGRDHVLQSPAHANETHASRRVNMVTVSSPSLSSAAFCSFSLILRGALIAQFPSTSTAKGTEEDAVTGAEAVFC